VNTRLAKRKSRDDASDGSVLIFSPSVVYASLDELAPPISKSTKALCPTCWMVPIFSCDCCRLRIMSLGIWPIMGSREVQLDECLTKENYFLQGKQHALANRKSGEDTSNGSVLIVFTFSRLFILWMN
ncbi:hypothetical protein Avbf_15578, partial [Armadillidium vulgare]